MDGTPNGTRPVALKNSIVLITVAFFSPEKFLRRLDEALPTCLSRVFLNLKQAFRGGFLLSNEGAPRKAMIEAEYSPFLFSILFFFLFCQGPWEPLDDLNVGLTWYLSVIPLLRYTSPAPFLGSEICGPLGGSRFNQHIRLRCSEP